MHIKIDLTKIKRQKKNLKQIHKMKRGEKLGILVY